MAVFKVRCNNCKTILQAKSDYGKQIRITCPRCSKVHELTLPNAKDGGQNAKVVAAKPVAQAISPAGDSPFEFVSDDLAPSNFSSAQSAQPSSSGNSYYAPPPKKRARRSKKKDGMRRWLLGVGGVAAVTIVIGGGVVVAMLLSPGEEGGLANIGSTISQAVNFDSQEKVSRDLLAECKRIEQYGKEFLNDKENQTLAEQLLAEQKVFHQLVRRGAALSLQHKTAAMIETEKERIQAIRDEWENMTQEAREQAQKEAGLSMQSLDEDFWKELYGFTLDHYPVDYALTRLTRWRNLAAAMSSVAISFPDPSSDPPLDSAWTQDERHMLEAYHIRAEFKRDFYRALGQSNLEDLENGEYTSLHGIIDQYTERAAKLAARETAAGKASKMFVKVPKGTPYELFDSTTGIVALGFRRLLEDDVQSNDQLLFLLQDQVELSDAIENLVFSPKFTIDNTSEQRFVQAQRLQAEKLAREDKARREQLAAEKAEMQRRERELAQKEADRLRRDEEARQNAEKKAQAEEERREVFADMRNRGSDIANGAARRIPGGRGGFGPGSSGPRNVGPGDFGSSNTLAGRRPSSALQERPAADPKLAVVIKLEQVSELTTRYVVESAPEELRKFGLSVSAAGKSMTITVRGFDQPLESLAKLFPYLEFDRIDTKTRTIVAREKAE